MEMCRSLLSLNSLLCVKLNTKFRANGNRQCSADSSGNDRTWVGVRVLDKTPATLLGYVWSTSPPPVVQWVNTYPTGLKLPPSVHIHVLCA